MTSARSWPRSWGRRLADPQDITNLLLFLASDDAAFVMGAGVSTELHVHPGMPHAFDVLLLGDDLRYQADRIRVIRSV